MVDGYNQEQIAHEHRISQCVQRGLHVLSRILGRHPPEQHGLQQCHKGDGPRCHTRHIHEDIHQQPAHKAPHQDAHPGVIEREICHKGHIDKRNGIAHQVNLAAHKHLNGRKHQHPQEILQFSLYHDFLSRISFYVRHSPQESLPHSLRGRIRETHVLQRIQFLLMVLHYHAHIPHSCQVHTQLYIQLVRQTVT